MRVRGKRPDRAKTSPIATSSDSIARSLPGPLRLKSLTSDGVKKLILKGGVAGKSKILIQGKDGNLPLPPLPLDPNRPVIAQLSSSDPNLPCYEETFTQANVTKNEAKQFKAKTP